MSNRVTNLLLKHGIEGLYNENENFFKQNIVQAIALKLHESMNEIKEAVSKELLNASSYTDSTPEINEFVKFFNNFKPGIHEFKNGSSINITESDMELLKNLFESLNPQNRQKMVSEILEDGAAFKQHILFSKKVKQIL